MNALTVSTVMMLIIFVTLLIGFPIALGLGAGAVVAMMLILPFEQAAIVSAQRMFTGINSFSLLAIPFFVLAGNIMSNGGIAGRLIDCARLVASRLPGYLAQTNIVSNMLFGCVSGSGMAATAAMGSILAPLEEKEGYDKNFSAAVNAASGPAGMLIPPSNIMIIFAMTAGGVSIAALFVGGYIPGILWGLGCMVVAGFQAKKRGYTSREIFTFWQGVTILWRAIPSLFLIVVVIGGILGGIFTPTEGSAIAVAYSLLLSIIYRSIKLEDMPNILFESVKITAVVQFLVCMSAIMSFVMARTRLPQTVATAVLGVTDNFIIVILLINILMLIIGLFLDPTPSVLILTPIFLPIALMFGMHPVHFGIMLVFNKSIGTITPPVGPILFTACRVGNVKIEGILGPLWPYYIMLVLLLLLVIFIPGLSLALPRALGLIV